MRVKTTVGTMPRKPERTHWSFYIVMGLIMLVVLTFAGCVNAELSKRCHDRGGTYVPSKTPICIGGR